MQTLLALLIGLLAIVGPPTASAVSSEPRQATSGARQAPSSATDIHVYDSVTHMYDLHATRSLSPQDPRTGKLGPLAHMDRQSDAARRALSGSAFAADSADLAGTGVTRALTTSELRSVRSLEQRVAEHQAKLDAYRANPDAFDNLGILERAGTADIRQSIIDGRIRHLEGEISTFQDQIDKLLGGGQ